MDENRLSETLQILRKMETDGYTLKDLIVMVEGVNECLPHPKKGTELEVRVSAILKDLGVPGHLLGYEYLKDAIILAYKDPAALNHITGCIYPEVAKQHGTTAPKIERGIRNAIECTFKRADGKILRRYFGGTIASLQKLTNSEFIAVIGENLRLENLEG